MSGCLKPLTKMIVTLAVLLASSNPTIAASDALWSSRPYRVSIELDLDASGLDAAQAQRLRDRLADRLAFRLGRFWHVDLGMQASGGPEQEAELVASAADTTEGESQQNDGVPLPELDKRFRVRVVARGVGGEVRALEHDVTLDHTSQPITMTYAGSADLPERLYAAVLSAFRPITRFVRDPKKPSAVTLAYRASDLASSSGVAVATENQLLLPFRRRVDRSGLPVEGGTKGVRWTYLIASEKTDDGPPSATVVSHKRRPFGTRPSAKLQQLALVAPVNRNVVTRLRFQSVDDAETPLPGYEVQLARPGKPSRESIGFSDENGEVVLPKRPGVWTAHVKCGSLTVASIPVTSGVDEVILAPLVDERSRLRAELEVTSLREELIDTVARRKILGQRIRRHVENERPEAAARLLTEMDELRGRTQFDRDLGVIERGVRAGHPVAQKRIEQLFEKTRSLINSALDPRESRELGQLVTRAKRDAAIREDSEPGAS